MICDTFEVEGGIGTAWMRVESASCRDLELFQRNPRVYGPTLTSARLDTSGSTAAKAKSSDWNLILIGLLAKHAQSQAARASDPREYSLPDPILSWEKLISGCLNRILDDIYRSRRQSDEGSGMANAMNLQTETNRRNARSRANRSWVSYLCSASL